MRYVWNFAMGFFKVLDTAQEYRFWSQPSHLCRMTQTRHIPVLGAIIAASMLDVSKVDTPRCVIAGQGGRHVCQRFLWVEHLHMCTSACVLCSSGKLTERTPGPSNGRVQPRLPRFWRENEQAAAWNTQRGRCRKASANAVRSRTIKVGFCWVTQTRHISLSKGSQGRIPKCTFLGA
jgi:hypothetical protein